MNTRGEAASHEETVGAATRAIADATATLTKLLARQVATVGTEVNDVIASSLREAARGLAEASETVDRHTGGRRSEERRQARVERTRAELLAAAARVFAARGFEGASVGDIAAEAGYTKGALYAHFGSKGDLFLDLAREKVVTGAPAPPGPVDLAAEITAGLAVPCDDMSMLLTLEMLAYTVRYPQARDELAPLFRRALLDVAARVRDDRLARPGATGHVAGDPREPADDGPTVTDDDLDTALGLLAVTNFAQVFAAFSDGQDDTAAGARLAARLLRR